MPRCCVFELRVDRRVPSAAGVVQSVAVPTVLATKPRASERWADAKEMLVELKLQQYTEQFVEEEMTSMDLLEVCWIVAARHHPTR